MAAFQVGVTGGIGSGKTTVCRMFEVLGIPVYYADVHAKRLMTESPALVAGVKNLFGSEAYLPDGTLHRTHIARIAFNNQQKLQQLNALVHPAVHNDSVAWHRKQTKAPYTLYEAALMVESGGYKKMRHLIVVFATEETRIRRVMQRDGSTRKEVLARIRKQLPEIEKVRLADFVINNEGGHSLIQQVYALHRRLLKLGDF